MILKDFRKRVNKPLSGIFFDYPSGIDSSPLMARRESAV
jgi:hypothetical protein